MRSPIRRRTRSLLAALTTVAAVAAVPAVASATPQTTAKSAADWLSTQLQGSPANHFVTTYSYNGSTGSYNDYGLTLDGFFAFTAATSPNTAGTYTTQATNTLNYVRDNLNAYVGTGTTTASTCATTGTLYAGALGKYALAMLAAGRNPTSTTASGGRNVISDLRCREASTGRFSDTPDDYSVTFSQALGILAVKRYYGTATPPTNPNGSTLATAVNYLISQQCASGAFASGEGTGNSGNCTTANPADVDSTAYAALALQATGNTTQANSALSYLDSVKQTPAANQYAWKASAPCDGQSSTALSVNSTALAIVANASASTPKTPLAYGQNWLVTQAKSSGALTGCPSSAPSVPAVQASNDVRATTQGVLGLLGSKFGS